MRILAVDTSTMAAGVALLESNRVRCDLRVSMQESHAPRLLTLIHRVLALASVPLESIDVFAVSQGPGSFTGLRIGIATVMGLAYARGRIVLGVDTLQALAMKASFAPAIICPVLDARKGEVVGALFRTTREGLKRLTPNLVMRPDGFCANITQPTLMLGPGVDAYQDVWHKHLGDRVMFAPPWLGMPCSVEVGVLALTQVTSSHGGPSAAPTPVYVRASEAEVNWSRQAIINE